MEDNVNHPKHYQTPGGLECIDIIKSVLTKDEYIASCRANVLKYVIRYKSKGQVESLKKARWYLDEMISSLEHIED